MTEVILISSTALFLIFILIREKQHADEVRLLSKALIAKNIYEFKDSEKTDEKGFKEELSKYIPADEVSDDVFMGAIRKELKKETAVDKFKDKVKNIWPTIKAK